jgi:hypothetical protein
LLASCFGEGNFLKLAFGVTGVVVKTRRGLMRSTSTRSACRRALIYLRLHKSSIPKTKRAEDRSDGDKCYAMRNIMSNEKCSAAKFNSLDILEQTGNIALFTQTQLIPG